jgi:hypothetical protein
MKKTNWPGKILIKESTLLPETLQLETEPFAIGWNLVKDLDGYELSRKLQDEHWTFFYLAGEITATCLGFGGQNTERRAVKQLLARAKSTNFNSIEIARTVFRRFLGVPYTTVHAHARHLQNGMVLLRLENLPERNRQKSPLFVAPGDGNTQTTASPFEEAARKPGLVATASS